MSLLQSLKVGGITVPNRFMRSSLWEKMSDVSGVPSKKLLSTITELSVGKVGMILPGVVFPYPKARLNPFQAGFCTPEQYEPWRSAINDIHKNGSKIMFQFSHGGLRAAVPRGPTASEQAPDMTVLEIEELLDALTNSSKAAYKIGADGVQLQCAQGFLLSLFLSPLFNHRTDKYGGSLEKRVRIVQEAVSSIRKQTDKNFVISIKMNGDDCVEGGIKPEEAAQIVNRLNEVDLFEISCAIKGGMDGTRPIINTNQLFKGTSPEEKKQLELAISTIRKEAPYYEGYNVIAATIIKKANPNKIIAAVGGNRDFSLMESYIKSGMIDIVSLGRPFIREPHLIRDYMDGKVTKAACRSCNECSLKPGDFIHCHFPSE